jgi:hypothetical protein
MRKGALVYRQGDTYNVGIVKETKGSRARVTFSDAPKKTSWYDVDDLSPVTSFAPVVKDLEFVTRIHPDTKAVYIERDADFRGDEDPGPVIETPEDLYELFEGMGWLDQEHLVVGLLDTRWQLIGWKLAHKGAIDNVQASAKDMLKDAILGNARCMFFLHNHPSGDPSPSQADAELTAAVQELLAEYDLCLFDHLIIGRPGIDPRSREDRAPYFSFREEGLLEPIEDEEEQEP